MPKNNPVEECPRFFSGSEQMKRIEFDNRVEQLEQITGISPKHVDL